MLFRSTDQSNNEMYFGIGRGNRVGDLFQNRGFPCCWRGNDHTALSAADGSDHTDDELDEMRREAINNVRRTRGKIKLDDIAKGWYNKE